MTRYPLSTLVALLLCTTTAQARPTGPAPEAATEPVQITAPTAGQPRPAARPVTGPGSTGYGPMRHRPPIGGPVDRSGDRRSIAGRQAAAAVSAGLDKLFELLRSEEVPNKLQTAAFLDREIAPYFDFDRMARFVAGRDWDYLDAEQRKALAAQLESRILGGLARELAEFRDQKVRFLRPRPSKHGRVDVQVGLVRSDSYPMTLMFRLYPTEGEWRIYDVVAEGRSLVGFYRDAFDALTQVRADTR
ncbi:MAG: ABC transporter substrate-binding protein [Thiohalocapsa sp.]|jgi:phospholipid transport system substrate-binding protein